MAQRVFFPGSEIMGSSAKLLKTILCLSKNPKQKLIVGQVQPLSLQNIRNICWESRICLSCSTGFAFSVFAFFYLTFCTS